MFTTRSLHDKILASAFKVDPDESASLCIVTTLYYNYCTLKYKYVDLKTIETDFRQFQCLYRGVRAKKV